MHNASPAGENADPPPSNAFVPVRGCWICTVIETVAHAAWRGENGLALDDWLSVNASGMHHRMNDHGLHPTGPTPRGDHH